MSWTTFAIYAKLAFVHLNYSFLVKHTDNDVAEVVRISADFIDSIKTGIELATVHIGEGDIGSDWINLHHQECLEQSYSEAFSLLRFSREPLQ